MIKYFSVVKVGILLVGIIAILNLAFLDVWIMNAKTNLLQGLERVVPAPIPTSVISQTCPVACISDMQNLLATASTTPLPQKVTTIIQNSSSGAKEYYVTFGSGQSSASDWQDVTGLQLYVDSTSYSSIKSIVFEATAHIPTGNESAWVRLFNSTDQHPVWNSDISLEGGTPQFLISSPITLDPGKKLYTVQMKTQLQFQAVLDQSRIHIITK